jgi:hypothetical protein
MRTKLPCLVWMAALGAAGAARADDGLGCRSAPQYTVGSFPAYEYEIAKSEEPTLDRIAAHVQATLGSQSRELERVVIVGHAALYGQSDFDQTSEYRASLVAAELRARLKDRGIDYTTLDIQSIGVGTRCPIATNATQAGRASNRRVEVWIEEVEKRGGGGKRGGKDADETKIRPDKAGRLSFSPNSVKHPPTGLLFPADMPAPRLPNDFDGCSDDQKGMLREAWALAHYYMWRSDQVMDWLAVHEAKRQQAWDAGAKQQKDDPANFVPRTWFGPYAEGRFRSVDDAIDRVFTDRLLGRTFKVACKPGEPENLAQHNVFGRVVFFHSPSGGYFHDDPKKKPSEDRAFRALTVVHELYHPLKLRNGTWVMDTHAFMGRVAKHYDAKDSQKLSWGETDRHYRLAIRNNDNHAYFATNLGEAIYAGTLQQFP